MTFYGPQSCSLGGQGHSNDFPWASKLQFASLQRIQTSKIPNTFPNKHHPQQAPQIHSNDFLDAFKAALTEARATAMTFYGPQSCSLPACKGSKLPKFQTPSPTCTLGPRPLPQQAPQGQATAMAFLGFQSCRLPARKPSKTLQTLQALQNPPNPSNTVPSRHLRSTAMAFLGFQSCRLPARKPSKTLQNSPNAPNPPKPAKPFKHRPQQAPQIHSNDFLCPQQAPQGQATAMAFLGFQSCRLPARKPSKTLQNSPNAPSPPKPAKPFKHRPQQAPQIHSNGFLRLSKLPFASPQTLQNSPKLSKRSKPSKTRQTLQTPSPAGTSDPQQ